MIRVFIGVQGSGKDFEANAMMKESPGVKIAFADEVRKMTWELLGYEPLDEKAYDEFKKDWKIIVTSKEGKGNVMSGRKFMQVLGTDVIRKRNTNFWVDLAYQKIDEYFTMCPEDDIYITDCRFDNEAKMLIDKFPGNVVFYWCNWKDAINNMDDEHESELFAKNIGKKDMKHLEIITESVKDFVFEIK